MQATPRNARINIEDVYHVVATIGLPPYPVSRPKSAYPLVSMPMVACRHSFGFIRRKDECDELRLHRAPCSPPTAA